MPSITAIPMGEAPGLMEVLDPANEAAGVYDHYPYRNVEAGQAGCAGVQMLAGAYDVPIQQVTSDSQLVPSVVKFTTDGAPVLIVYENGCCVDDSVRPGRNGGRGILNAFELERADRPAKTAGVPNPCDGGLDIPAACVSMQWEPGVGAASHRVYFGTDAVAVENAQPGSSQYKGELPLGAESFRPGELTDGTTYYWRIDEQGDEGTVKGRVWSFTTAGCEVLEDFERHFRFVGAGGSEGLVEYMCRCGDETYSQEVMMPDAECDPREGEPSPCQLHHKTVAKAMKVPYYGIGYAYSAAEMTFSASQDWTIGRPTAVAISFRGEQGQALPERMYIELEDEYGNSSQVDYSGSLTDIQSAAWLDWTTNLDDFAGVDLAAVKKLSIGIGHAGGEVVVGNVYVDDIKLCRGRCVAGQGPSQDLNEDCIVNFGDHAVKAQTWANTAAKRQDYKLLAEQWLEEILVWP
jgi:hypothetical protein